MAGEPEQKSSVPLPPKLDLRRMAAKPAPVVEATTVVPLPASTAPGSSSTMRINLQNEAPTIRAAPAPAASAASAVRVQPVSTVEVKKPVVLPSPPPSMAVKPLVVMPAPSAPAADKKPSSKSETSRIPLELATPSATNAAAGKPASMPDMRTIRVKPAAGATVAAVPPAGAGKPVDDKRKTSRISLESALAMEDKGGAPGAPKTIRLKRPGETAGAKVPSMLDAIKAEPAAGKAAAGQTAPLEGAAEEAEGPTPTRRKTIMVKRPGGEKTGMTMATGGAAKSVGQGAVAVELEGKESSGAGIFDWVAMAAATLTIIMSFVVMFMLASQAWGPNACLTELSSWPTGPDWSWAGKTPRAQ